MLIYVDAPSGRTTGISLKPGDKVGDLKVRIEVEEWIPKDRQYLTYRNDKLEDGHTFESYGIEEGATILLNQIGVAFPIVIRFPTRETIVRILVEGINTIESLKSRFHAWVPRDMQQLIFDGRELEDKKLVLDYNIKRDSTLDLQTPFNLYAPLPNWIAGSVNITIKTMTGKTLLIRVKGTDTIENLKSHIQNREGIPPDQQRLVFDRKHLEDRWTIYEYGIPDGGIIFCVLRLRGGGPQSDDTKDSLGLVNIAQAISLWNWDGIMPGPAGKHAIGLQLSKGEVVTVGRIVNDKWYQGFNNKHKCGYFPRAFVSVRKIIYSEFKDDIHVDDTPIEDLHVDVINTPSVKAPPKLLVPILAFFQRLLGIISRPFPSTPLPIDSDRPDLPPSPVPAPPAFDRIVDGNRVLLQLSLDPKDNQRNYILRATLSLNSAPGTRFSGLTFNVNLADGTILAISPENVVGPETEAEVTKDKNHQVSLNTSLQAGSAPVSASIGASTTFSRAEHITFTRKTHGTVQGNGVGSSKAYWVMKADDGPAAEQGLGPVFDLRLSHSKS